MNKEYITDYKARLEKGLAEFMELSITGFGGGLLFTIPRTARELQLLPIKYSDVVPIRNAKIVHNVMVC